MYIYDTYIDIYIYIVCVCVCVYVCMCVCVHIYVYIYIHTHTHCKTHTYIGAGVRPSTGRRALRRHRTPPPPLIDAILFLVNAGDTNGAEEGDRVARPLCSERRRVHIANTWMRAKTHVFSHGCVTEHMCFGTHPCVSPLCPERRRVHSANTCEHMDDSSSKIYMYKNRSKNKHPIQHEAPWACEDAAAAAAAASR